MSVDEELDKLKRMLDDRTITGEQYDRARAKLLRRKREEGAERAGRDDEREERRPRRARDDDYDDEGDEEYERRPPRRKREKRAREWCLFLHLSLLAGHTVPLGGLIAPIVIWQTQKEEYPEVDEHGRNAANWILSNLLYLLICIPLCFVIVGIPLLMVLGVLNVVFPIIAGLKAYEGQVWKYPLAIPFLK